MNNQISWDETLVKKYSSSNHFKLLTQLRNEIEKYPLNKKKNKSFDQQYNNKFDSNNNQIKSTFNDFPSTNNPNINNDLKNNKTTVSFNNSKNFSIYNNTTKDSTNEQRESKVLEGEEANDKLSSSTFKERLNQIDMK